MQDYLPQPVVIREVNGCVVAQDGHQALVDGQPARMVEATEIVTNHRHYLRAVLRSVMPRLESGEVAAIVIGKIGGKPATILITAEQFAAGAPERARYSAWLAALTGERSATQAKERAYDLVNNEGGEGYNPYRSGGERTYARNHVSQDRELPEGA